MPVPQAARTARQQHDKARSIWAEDEQDLNIVCGCDNVLAIFVHLMSGSEGSQGLG